MCKLGEVFLAAAGAFFPQKLRSWDSMTCNLHVFKCIYIDFVDSHGFFMDLHCFCMDFIVFYGCTWIYMDLDAISVILLLGHLLGMDFHGFSWIYMEFQGF